jgi:hypothetical protein
MSRPVYSDGRVHVMSEKCSTCIFRPGNLMNLNPGVVKTMVDESIAQGGGITCHKTLQGQAEQEATCRGFFDAHADKVPAFALAKDLGVIEEVPP